MVKETFNALVIILLCSFANSILKLELLMYLDTARYSGAEYF